MNEHPEDQAAPVPDKGHEVMQTLAGFGIDRDTLRSIMEPMIVDVITAQTPKLLAELPNMLDKMLTAKMDQLTASLVGQIDGRVKAIVGAAASVGQTNGTAATPAAAPAGGNDMVAGLLGLVLKKIMGPAAGDATGGTQLQGVLNYAASMNTIMTQVLDPVMSLYNRGATDERARMTALSKMGIEVPLGETPPPPTEPLPVKATVDNRPVAAELHQVDNVASSVAARIKLS